MASAVAYLLAGAAARIRLIIRLASSQVAALSREFNIRLIPSAHRPTHPHAHPHRTGTFHKFMRYSRTKVPVVATPITACTRNIIYKDYKSDLGKFIWNIWSSSFKHIQNTYDWTKLMNSFVFSKLTRFTQAHKLIFLFKNKIK